MVSHTSELSILKYNFHEMLLEINKELLEKIFPFVSARFSFGIWVRVVSPKCFHIPGKGQRDEFYDIA